MPDYQNSQALTHRRGELEGDRMSMRKDTSRGEANVAAYALAHIRFVRIGPEITKYLERIDATLAPFGGHFSSTATRPRSLKGNGVETS